MGDERAGARVLPVSFNMKLYHHPCVRAYTLLVLQYIRYFTMCYKMLYPDSGMTEAEQRSALEVTASLFTDAHAHLCVCVLYSRVFAEFSRPWGYLFLFLIPSVRENARYNCQRVALTT